MAVAQVEEETAEEDAQVAAMTVGEEAAMVEEEVAKVPWRR